MLTVTETSLQIFELRPRTDGCIVDAAESRATDTTLDNGSASKDVCPTVEFPDGVSFELCLSATSWAGLGTSDPAIDHCITSDSLTPDNP